MVIMIGRKRSTQPWRMASRADSPCSRSATRAKSIIMMAFFLTMPMSRMMPIMPMIERSWPNSMSASSAPTPAEGRVEMIVSGWIALS